MPTASERKAALTGCLFLYSIFVRSDKNGMEVEKIKRPDIGMPGLCVRNLVEATERRGLVLKDLEHRIQPGYL